MITAWQKARLRVYDRDAVTERTGSPLTGRGLSWEDDGGEGGLTFTAPWLAQSIQDNPTLLRDAFVVVETQLTAGGAWVAIHTGLTDVGRGVLLDEDEDADREETFAARGGLALFDDMVVLHDGGVVNATGGDTRAYGFMQTSYDDSAWSNAVGFRWDADTTKRAGWPEEFATLDPGAKYIGLVSPDTDLPAGTRVAYRKTFTVAAVTKARLFVAGDNYVDLWFGAEPVYSSDDAKDAYAWKYLLEPWDVTLQPGVTYTIAAIVTNSVDTIGLNALGLVATLMELDDLGLPTTRILHTDETWKVADADTVAGVTAASIVLTELDEMIGWDAGPIPAAQRITPTFTAALDSDAVAWPDLQERAVTIGTKGMALLSDLSSVAFDVRLNADLTLDAWVDRGTDLSASVTIATGEEGLFYYDFDGVPLVCTRLLVHHAKGYLLLQDTTAEALHDARADFLDSGLSLSAAQGGAVAETNLGEQSRPHHEYMAKLIATATLSPYLHFGIGDLLTGMDYTGAPLILRVAAIAGALLNDDGNVAWTLTLKEP